LTDEQKDGLKKIDNELPQLLSELQWRGPELKALAAKWKGLVVTWQRHSLGGIVKISMSSLDRADG